LNYNELEEYLLVKEPKNYAGLMDTLYEFYSKIVLAKDVKLYGDKNNYYLNHVGLLHKLYPYAKFIHIIRDGRSVAASYQGLMKAGIDSRYAPNLPVKIEEIAKEWLDNIDSIEKGFNSLPEQLVYTIKYEDLILESENTLQQVCTFLNLDYHLDMLEYYKTDEKDGLEPKEYMAWKSKNLHPIIKDEIYKYNLLTDVDRKKFEEITREKLAFYGYLK
jgi:hypothetical protein